MAENEPGEGMAFGDIGEIHHALANKVITLHTKIKGRFKSVDADGNPTSGIFETTPGRMLIAELLPKNHEVPFDACNKLMTKKEISKMIDTVYRACGQKETVIFCDRIMGSASRTPVTPASPSAWTTWSSRTPSRSWWPRPPRSRPNTSSSTTTA
jgi:DNA-directed RNA polymerase subunit beta'